MVRALAGLVGLFGGAAVFIAGLSARNPLDALRAIAAGVGLLVFVSGVGLADLIDVTRIAARLAHLRAGGRQERRPSGHADEGDPPASRG